MKNEVNRALLAKKNLFRNILIASVILSLNCADAIAAAMPNPAPIAQTAAEKKKKEAEKKKKEAAKKKAAAAKAKQKAAAKKKKEADKKKAVAQKERDAKASERAKVAAERAKIAAEREEAKLKKEAEIQAKEEKAIRDWEKYQEQLENPKTEVISLFNLGFRTGYAAMMDKINPDNNNLLWGAGTLNTTNALQQLKGGIGAGLDFTYNLACKNFLFEVGVDFRYLNSTSAYGFQATRTDLTYGATYNYLFDNMRETRNMMQVGVPIMVGAQFDKYYFMVGAKIGYSIFGNYSHKGKYDIIVNDPALLEPYGMGIHNIPSQTNTPITFAQPEVSVAAEIGIDLDEWLQAQPYQKQPKVKPGERLPFGPEHVHYRVSLFAEYGVLNTNKTAQALPVEFAANDVYLQKTNTMLAMNGNTILNNLFVGAKFTIQFEVPGKTARPVPPPPAYTFYSVVDEATNSPLQIARIQTTADKNGKIALREKQITPKGLKQKHPLGAYTVVAKADNYYDGTEHFEIDQPGSKSYVTIKMKHRPVLRVRVTNKETGEVIPAMVQIRKRGLTENAYSLQTDSTTGATKQMLEEGPEYMLHIAQIGYDTLNMDIAHIGDSMNVQLTPIKKGEIFIVKNLFFATNKTRILPTSEQALNDLYMFLARNPQVTIRIIGHTDSVGKDAANQKLSDGRANAVMNDLIERGIAAERMQAEGRGETQHIDTNDTEEGRQNNRRVEIEILSK